jgi:hypothetical protein
MTEYLQLIGYTLFLYLCVYGVIGRICKCVELHTEWKYRARVDAEWLKQQNMSKSGCSSDRREANQNVRCEGNSMHQL